MVLATALLLVEAKALPAAEPNVAASLYRQGVAALKADRSKEAIGLFRRAAALEPTRLDYTIHLARTLNASARFAESNQMLRRRIRSGIRTAAAAKLNAVLGETYEAWADSEAARSHFMEAIAIYRKCVLIDRRARLWKVASDLDSMGSLHAALSRFGEAARLFSAALERERSRRDFVGQSITLFNMGALYAGLNRADRASKYYESAIAISQRLGDREGVAAGYTGLGDMYSRLGRFEQARRCLLRSLPVARALGNPKHTASVLHDMGFASLSLGRNGDALRELTDALSFERKAGDRDGEATTLLVLGNLHERTANPETARLAYSKSLAIADELAIPGTQAGALTGLMSASKSLGKPSLAIYYGKQAVNRIQSIRASLRSLDEPTQRSYLTSRSPAYRLLADILIDEGRLSEAEQVLAMLKEQEYFEFVRRDSGPRNVLDTRATLTSTEEAANERYSVIVNDLTRLGVRRRALLSLKTRSPDQNEELNAVNRSLTAANTAYGEYFDTLQSSFSTSISKDENVRMALLGSTAKLQKQLAYMDPGTVLVLTVVTDSRICLIVVTPDTQVSREVPIRRQEVNHLVATFRSALEDPTVDPRPAGRALWDLLVAPILGDVEGARPTPDTPLTLLWSLDDSLRYMPTSALWNGDQYACELWRSAMITLAAGFEMKDEPADDWRALGLGVSKAHEGFSKLDSVPKELHSVVRTKDTEGGVLPGIIWLDDDFTEMTLRRDLPSKWPVVHIASHFAFNPGTEADSALLLGDGKRLSVETFRNDAGLDMEGVDLLTLSACDTASGATGTDGKEVEGLAAVLQERGAKAVLASLWPVADPTTAVLMREFYAARQTKDVTTGRNHLTKAEALQKAQLALLRGSVDVEGNAVSRGSQIKGRNHAESPPFVAPESAPYAHPYYWAPFILIGNCR